MKLIRLVLLALSATFVVGVLIDSKIINEKFEQFKLDFNKDYRNRLEEFVAKIYFTASLDYIERKNRNPSLAFNLSLNQFSDTNPKRTLWFTKVNMQPVIDSRAILFINPANFPPAPPAIDFRDTGCVTPVKDQSYFCNSCYAFSGIASLESQWCLKKNVSVTMSEQMIIDCTNGFSGNKGCGGGSQGPAYIYIQTVSFGIESDTTYPYEETFWHATPFPCRYNRSRSVATTTGYFRIRTKNETEIVNIIAKVGPVSAAMNGGIPTFWYYSSGVYNDPECFGSMSHSVLIVGYGTDYSYDPPMPYWLCKNSWSDSWGDSGFFKIQRGVNLCGIAAFLIYPDVDNSSVTTTTARPTTTTTRLTTVTSTASASTTTKLV